MLRTHVLVGPLALAILLTRQGWADPVEKVRVAEAEAQARQCFQRGLELFDEKDLDGASVEFRRAYDLARSFRILFNLGQVAAEKHDYAAGLEFFRRYLKDGAGKIPEERRHTVEEEMAKFRQRVGQLDVAASGMDAEVLIDDEPMGWVSLGSPWTVNVGRRRVSIRTKDGVSAPKFVDVPGGEVVRVEFKQPSAGHAARVPAVPSSPASAELAAPTTRSRSSAAVADGKTSGPWLAWTATGLCALAAVTSGILAYRWEQDLRDQRNAYPATQNALTSQQGKVRTAGWVTDGLVAGTTVLAVISLTLTFRGSHDKSVSLSTRGLTLRQSF